jgi:hypothetical protein
LELDSSDLTARDGSGPLPEMTVVSVTIAATWTTVGDRRPCGFGHADEHAGIGLLPVTDCTKAIV